MKHSAALLMVLAVASAARTAEKNDAQDRFRRQLMRRRERDLGVSGANKRKQRNKLHHTAGALEGMQPQISQMAADIEHLIDDVEHDLEHMEHDGKKKKRKGNHKKKEGRKKKEKKMKTNRTRHGKSESGTEPTAPGGTDPTKGPSNRHHGKAEKDDEMDKAVVKTTRHNNGKARKLKH